MKLLVILVRDNYIESMASCPISKASMCESEYSKRAKIISNARVSILGADQKGISTKTGKTTHWERSCYFIELGLPEQ